MYRITYSKGEIVFQVSSTTDGYKAQAKDVSNETSVLLTANDPDDLYDKCRSWASTNIHGEFMLQSIDTASNAAAGRSSVA